jgi:nucleoid-associated protein YgaU
LASASVRPLRTEYTIKAGDTFTSIAQEWFDDGTKWSLIARENPTVDPARLKIGQKVYLPPKDAAVASSHEAGDTQIVPAEGELIYTVREGDTLSSIARQHYDDPARWKDIYEANRATIGSDAGALEVGMKLRLKMVKRG